MEIKRSGSQPSGKGPADYFTGTVRIEPAESSSRSGAGDLRQRHVRARRATAWHTHPLGQTLNASTAGCGYGAALGSPIEQIRPGDVIWFPPGEKHWHGAAPTTAMTHIAIQEQLDGKRSIGWKRSAMSNIRPNRSLSGCRNLAQGCRASRLPWV